MSPSLLIWIFWIYHYILQSVSPRSGGITPKTITYTDRYSMLLIQQLTVVTAIQKSNAWPMRKVNYRHGQTTGLRDSSIRLATLCLHSLLTNDFLLPQFLPNIITADSIKLLTIAFLKYLCNECPRVCELTISKTRGYNFWGNCSVCLLGCRGVSFLMQFLQLFLYLLLTTQHT